MKVKTVLWIIGVLAVVIQFIDFRLPETSISGDKDVALTENMPREVKEIMTRACYDCHSMQTRYPWYSHVAPVKWLVKNDIVEGRRHVNFSEWGSYEDKEKIKKLDDINEEVKKSEMPPSMYLLMHTDAKLTDQERQKIISWADSTADSYLE